MLRRAENVRLSRTMFGRVTVQVGKKQHTLKRRPTKEEWTAERARQQSQPVLVLLRQALEMLTRAKVVCRGT